MKSLTLPYIPVIGIIISLMIILLPLSNSNELMNGIQTAKSFNFFYGMIGLLILMGGFVVLFLGHRVTQGKNINSGELCLTKLLKASLLAIMVFGCFGYPGEILPIKIVAVLCLGLLANYLVLKTSNSEAANEALNGAAKLLIIAAIVLITITTYTKITDLRSAYVTWNDAFDLYNYGLYEESLEEYEKAYPALKNNSN